MLSLLLIILLTATTGPASAVIARACNLNAECSEDECCLQMPYTTKFFCSKRMRPGQVCWNAPHNVSIEHDRFKVICPCVRYYECKFQNSFFPLKPVFAVSTCQPKPEESPEERNIYLREYEDRQRIIEYRRQYGDANRIRYFVG